MGETKPVLISSFKKGNYVVIDGVACIVTDTQLSRPGKHGHAKVRLTAVSIIDHKKKEVVLPGHDTLESPIIEKKNAQVLSVEGNTAKVMDLTSYETFDLEIPDELKDSCHEGSQIVYWEILDDRIMKQVKQ